MELVTGLIGASVGGLFVLVGSFLQARLHSKQMEARFEHERALAAEDHQRRQVLRENEGLRRRLQGQIDYGRRVLVAAARFQSYESEASETRSRTDILQEAIKFAGLDWDRPSPYWSWVHPEEIEDGEMRQLVSEHRRLVHDVDMALIFADGYPREYPYRLPADCAALVERASELARRVDVRCRLLQRAGQPL